MLCLSGSELYSRWVPLMLLKSLFSHCYKLNMKGRSNENIREQESKVNSYICQCFSHFLLRYSQCFHLL